jgi:hypothetical protein
MRNGLCAFAVSEGPDGTRLELSRLRKGAAAYGLDCNPCPNDKASVLKVITSAANVAHKRFRKGFSSEIEELDGVSSRKKNNGPRTDLGCYFCN